MSGPRYDMASPGISGALDDAARAIRQTLMPKRQRAFGAKLQTEDELDADGSHTPSNAGQQAQSSDASNGY